MHLTGLDLLLWVAGLAGHLILLSILLVRLRFQEFPIFTAFITANIGRTIALALVMHYGSKRTYFDTFWSLGILDAALQLAVVYEMYSLTFRPFGRWARDLRPTLFWLVSGSIGIAAALTWIATPPVLHWMQAVVIKGSFFSSAWMSELFVGMVALSVKAGLPSKSHVARISQGLGVYSVIDVLVETAHSYFGVGRDLQVYGALSHARMVAYLFCVAYWAVMLWQNAPSGRRLPESMRGQLIHLGMLVDSELRTVRARSRS